MLVRLVKESFRGDRTVTYGASVLFTSTCDVFVFPTLSAAAIIRVFIPGVSVTSASKESSSLSTTGDPFTVTVARSSSLQNPLTVILS